MTGGVTLAPAAPEWRNWQTHEAQNLASLTGHVGSIPTSGTTRPYNRLDELRRPSRLGARGAGTGGPFAGSGVGPRAPRRHRGTAPAPHRPARARGGVAFTRAPALCPAQRGRARRGALALQRVDPPPGQLRARRRVRELTDADRL